MEYIDEIPDEINKIENELTKKENTGK